MDEELKMDEMAGTAMDLEAKDDAYKRTAKRGMKKAGAFFFLLLLLEIPYAYLVYFVQDQFSPEKETLISILMTQGYLLLGAFLYLKLTKQHFVADLQVRKYKISTFFLSLVLLITAAPMASLLNVASQLFADNTTGVAIFSVTEQVPAWLGVLIIGCLPGFVEETIYRGIMYSAYRKYSVLTGVLVSAVSFGMMHLNFNQMLYAIYLGVIFAFVVEATGSLVSTMIMHMLFNAVNTAYVYLLPSLYAWLGKYYEEYANINIEELMSQSMTKEQLLPMMLMLTPLAIGGVVLSVLLIQAMAKINGRTLSLSHLLGDSQKKKGMKPVNVWLLLGWVFCLVVCVLQIIRK